LLVVRDLEGVELLRYSSSLLTFLSTGRREALADLVYEEVGLATHIFLTAFDEVPKASAVLLLILWNVV